MERQKTIWLTTMILIAGIGTTVWAKDGKKPEKKLVLKKARPQLVQALGDGKKAKFAAIAKIKALALKAKEPGHGAELLLQAAKQSKDPQIQRAAIFAAGDVLEKSGKLMEAAEVYSHVFKIPDPPKVKPRLLKARKIRMRIRPNQPVAKPGGCPMKKKQAGAPGGCPMKMKQAGGSGGCPMKKKQAGGCPMKMKQDGFSQGRGAPGPEKVAQARKVREWLKDNPRLAHWIVSSLRPQDGPPQRGRPGEASGRKEGCKCKEEKKDSSRRGRSRDFPGRGSDPREIREKIEQGVRRFQEFREDLHRRARMLDEMQEQLEEHARKLERIENAFRERRRHKPDRD